MPKRRRTYTKAAPVTRASTTGAVGAALGPRRFSATLSTGFLDCANERVLQLGIEPPPGGVLPAYLDHDRSLQIGAWESVRVVGSELRGILQLDNSRAADLAAQRIAGGGWSVSISFTSLERKSNVEGGWDHLRVRLLEASVVGFACTPSAAIHRAAAQPSSSCSCSRATRPGTVTAGGLLMAVGQALPETFERAVTQAFAEMSGALDPTYDDAMRGFPEGLRAGLVEAHGQVNARAQAMRLRGIALGL